MHGLGNDFVMIDGFQFESFLHDVPELARHMCHRRFGIGADGLIVVSKGEHDPIRMSMYNPDGSPSEMCGNGIRCVALFARRSRHIHENAFRCQTDIGSLEMTIRDDHQVTVDMGPAMFGREVVGFVSDRPEWFELPLELGSESFVGTALSTGNPHFVIFVEDVDAVDLERVGPLIEQAPEFPNRTNVHFAQAIDQTRVKQRTWERGAGATLACGTGACAVVAAGIRGNRLTHGVDVELPGGTMRIEMNEAGHFLMTGPAEFVYEGVWTPKPQAS